MFHLFKNIVFLTWLLGMFASLSIGLTWWSFQLTANVAQLTADATETAIKHRKEITKAVAKTKAKARLKRALVMVPLAGIAAGAYFEEQDYQEWVKQNPSGNRQNYACEVAALTAEVIHELLQEIPKNLIDSKERLNDQIPKCHTVNKSIPQNQPSS